MIPTTSNPKFDTRLMNWRKILAKLQDQPGTVGANNLTLRDGLRRVHAKILRTMVGTNVNQYNVHTVRRLEALMLKKLKPVGPRYPAPPVDPVVSDWSTRVVTNGGLTPSTNSINALSAFVSGCKADGLWSKMVLVNCFAPDSNIAAFTPLLRGPGPDPWVVTGGTPGLSANGVRTTGFTIAMGFVPSAVFAAGSAGVSVLLNNDGGNVAGIIGGTVIGTVGGATVFYLIPYGEGGGNGPQFGCWQYGAWSMPGAGINSGYGFTSANRVSTSDSRVFFRSEANAMSQLGSYLVLDNNAVAAGNAWVWRDDFRGDQLNNACQAFHALHLGLAQSDSNNLASRVRTMRQTLGGGWV
jgi:hypothetical protein